MKTSFNYSGLTFAFDEKQSPIVELSLYKNHSLSKEDSLEEIFKSNFWIKKTVATKRIICIIKNKLLVLSSFQ